MSYGLETYNQNGQTMLSVEQQSIRVFHVATIQNDGSMSIPGYVDGRCGFFVLTSPIEQTSGSHRTYIRMNGTTLEWQRVLFATKILFYFYR